LDKLDEFGYSWLPGLLRRSGGVISGSILIQSTLGSYFDQTDIDVYVKYIYTHSRWRNSMDPAVVLEIEKLPGCIKIDKYDYEKYPDYWKVFYHGYLIGVFLDRPNVESLETKKISQVTYYQWWIERFSEQKRKLF
jgi:hypothetical protein